MTSKPPPAFPDITGSCVTFSRRGQSLSMTLVGIGRIEVTLREWSSSRRFTRAVFRQTGVEIPLIDERTWRRGDWLLEHLAACQEKLSKGSAGK